MKRAREVLPLCILASVCIFSVFVWYVLLREERSNILTVAFLDVGQGDAIFIESPRGNQVLIDGGPDRSVLRRLGEIMPFYDRSIDLLIVSNSDKDHFFGFFDLIRSFSVSAVVESGITGSSKEYGLFSELIKDKLITRILARRGQKISLGSGVELEILFPDRDVSGLNTNDGSVIAKLTYGKISFLFMGDAPQNIERYLASIDGKKLDVDVLKVGHHGSKTSTSEELLGLSSPAYAVLSYGKDNKYGHPHKEVLDRLEQFKVENLAATENGTVIIQSDGDSVWIK